MKKITEELVKSFLKGEKKKKGNTSTDGESFFLHGNLIAEKKFGKISIFAQIWRTPTTKERLNGLLTKLNKPQIIQRNYIWYRTNGKEFFDGMEA